MKKTLLFFFPLILLSAPKFDDNQLVAMTPRYFSRNHTAPKLLGVNIYQTRQGRVFQVEIMTDRNRKNDDLGFAYSALTNIGQYAVKKLDQLIVVIHSDIRNNPPSVCVGDAKCSMDTFIHQKVSYEKWYKDCIYFKEL